MFALKARCCSHGMCMLVCNVCIQVLLVRCICPRSLLQPMILLFTLADWEDVPLFECGIFFILCWACFQLSRCCFLHGRIATTSSQLSSHKTSEAAVQTDAMDGSCRNGAMIPETIYVSSGGKCFTFARAVLKTVPALYNPSEDVATALMDDKGMRWYEQRLKQ